MPERPLLAQGPARLIDGLAMRRESTGSRGHCTTHASAVDRLAWPLHYPCVGSRPACVATALPMRRQSTGLRGHCSTHASGVDWLASPLQYTCVGSRLACVAAAVPMHRRSTGFGSRCSSDARSDWFGGAASRSTWAPRSPLRSMCDFRGLCWEPYEAALEGRRCDGANPLSEGHPCHKWATLVSEPR